MPLDPSIILGATNINAEAAKQTAQSAQAQATQNQLRLQQYSVAQAKSDFEDQQNLKAAWRQAGGDPDKTLATAAQLGVSPKAIQAFQLQQMQVRSLMDTHNKTVAETGKTNLDTMMEKNDAVAQAVEPLLSIKDPAEYAAKAPVVIQQKLNQHLITEDEAKAAMGMSQQQLSDYYTGLQSSKFHAQAVKNQTEQQTADAKTTQANVSVQKQANESAKQIEDSNQAKLNGAATTLTNALRSGGPVAYKKALDSFGGDELISGSFPTSDTLAKMNPSDTFSAINQGGMTAQQRQQSAQAQATLANTQKYQAQEIALRKQATSIMQQRLGLEAQKTQAAMFAAGLGPDGKPLEAAGVDILKTATQNTSDGRLYVDQDSSFKNLPKGEQMQLRNAASKAGIPLVTTKEAAAIKDVDTARNTVLGVFNTFMDNSGETNGMLAHGGRGLVNWVETSTGNNPKLDAANKNFLATIESLKSAGGAGSGLRITGKEIDKMGAMAPRLGDSKDQLRAKMEQINNLFQDKLNGALHRVPVTSGQSQPKATPAPASNAPKVGYTESGYRYKGGDPSQQSNWEKVN